MNALVLLSATFLGTYAFARPIVQVRDVRDAPAVAIVGWDAENPEYGLRTRLRRDGSHLGEGRVGEHRLFLSSVFVEANGQFAHATSHDGKLLRNSGTAKDIDACRYGNVCTAAETVGLGVSDEFLRAHRDSLVVTLRPKGGRHWSITLDGRVINAYLVAMDSVSASLKKP
jgi:hypothetical protein